MARSQGNSKAPVSSHRLFPAIVALWFAALFGMGSMVLPVILIERVVSLTGLGELVPAAAPPLGVTARIAISLTAAVLGATLGFWIAGKVAAAQGQKRPARVERHLRSANRSQQDKARRPISAKEELGNDPLSPPERPEPAAVPIPGRRRALAMAEDETPSAYLRQAAPLPGHQDYSPDDHPLMAPIEVVANRQAHLRNQAPRQEFIPQPEADDTLELDSFEVARIEESSDGEDGLSALKNTAHRPFAAPAEADSRQPSPVAQVAAVRAVPDFTMPGASTATSLTTQFAAPFSAPPTFANAPRMFGAPAAESVPQPDFAQPASPVAAVQPGFADTAPPQAVQPDFSRPAAPAEPAFAPPVPAAFAPLDFGADEDVFEAAPSFAPPQVFAPAPKAPVEQAPFARPDAFVSAHSADAMMPPVAAAAPPADPAAPLGTMGMAELAERLGRSMSRRMGRPFPPLPEAVASLAQEPVPPPVPQAYDAELAAEPPVAFARPEAEVPVGYDASEEPDAFVPPPPVIPEALRPVHFAFEDDEAEEEDIADLSFSLPVGRAEAVPAAFRPLLEESDDEVIGEYPVDREPQPYRAEDEIAEDDESGEEEAEDGVDSTAYASLLGMKRPFAAPAEFVRIELPEPESGEVEPAVVFPGHGGASVAPDFARPASAPDAQTTAVLHSRLFDAPASTSPASSPGRRATQSDPAETERALRSALATLQRVSGAA